MKCEICGNKTRVNYGNSRHIFCEKCSGSEKAAELISTEVNAAAEDKNKSEGGISINWSSPFVVGLLTGVISFIMGAVLDDATGINIIVWGVFILIGTLAASSVLIVNELKNIQKHIKK